MPESKNEILKKLERTLLNHRVATCPNPTCTKSIVAKEAEGRAGTNNLVYQCENEACEYHKSRVINISIGKSWWDDIKSASSNLGSKAIAAVFGFFILFATSVGSNVKNYFFGEEAPPAGQSENLQNKIDSLETAIREIENTPGSSTPSQPNNSNTQALQKENQTLKSQLENRNIYVPEGMVALVRNRIKSGDFANAKAVFAEISTDEDIKKSFNADIELKKRMMKLFAESYSDEYNWFPTKYFKDSAEFAVFLNFLETFPVPRTDIFLAKAYYNYPLYNSNLSNAEGRKFQLNSLKYYLTAAKNNVFNHENEQVIKEINGLLELYKLFKYKPGGVPEDYISIESAIENKNRAVLNRRIQEIENKIASISEN